MCPRRSARRSLFASDDGGDQSADPSSSSRTPPNTTASASAAVAAAIPNTAESPSQNLLPGPEDAQETGEETKKLGMEKEGAKPSQSQPTPGKAKKLPRSPSPAKSKKPAPTQDKPGAEKEGTKSSQSQATPGKAKAKKLSRAQSPSKPGEAKNLPRSQSPSMPVDANMLTGSQSPSKPGEAKNLPRSQSPSMPVDANMLPGSQSPSKSGDANNPAPTQEKPGTEKEGGKPSQSQALPGMAKAKKSSRAQSPSKPGDATNLPRLQLSEAKISNPAPIQKKPNKKRKLAPFKRTWSTADELRILEALAEHAESHEGALPEPSDLFAVLAGSLENRDASLDKLADKVRKLKKWHDKARLQGCPGDEDGIRLFKLCEKIWGMVSQNNSRDASSIALRRSARQSKRLPVVPVEVRQGGGGGGGGDDGSLERKSQQAEGAHVDVGTRKDKTRLLEEGGDVNFGAHKDNRGRVAEDIQVAYVRRELSELSSLYPYLAEEVKGYAHTHSCGHLIKTAFETIGDDEARYLDARCKKQKIDKLNLEMNQDFLHGMVELLQKLSSCLRTICNSSSSSFAAIWFGEDVVVRSLGC